jgi:hypothetical protein
MPEKLKITISIAGSLVASEDDLDKSLSNSSYVLQSAQPWVRVKYVIALLSWLVFAMLLCYIAFFYTFTDIIPEHVPENIGSDMAAHAITLQESAGLLVTISLALAALFGFSISKTFDENTLSAHISMVLTTIFGVSLTLVIMYAYGVYYAITVQTDRGLFFLDKIDPFLRNEIRWLMACAVLSISVLCWRCMKGLRGGGR